MSPSPLSRPQRGVFNDRRRVVIGDLVLSGRAFQAYVNRFMEPIEACHGPVPRFTAAETDRVGGLNSARAARAIALSSHDSGMRFYLRELPARSGLEIYRARIQTGTVSFTTPVFIPVLDCGATTWMSLTPSEIYSQVPGITRARGSVLIGGMGLGWFARQVLQQPGVTKVTVVDIRPSVLNYFGALLQRDFGDRVRLVQGDAFNAVRPSAYDTVLYDIWPGCGQSAGDARWTKVAKRHPNAWAW